MNLEELKKFLIDELDKSKIDNIEVIDVSKKTSLADYIIIGTGTSDRHIDSCIDSLRIKLKDKFDIIAKQAEGKSSGWILLDLNYILVNLFTAESRQEYKLDNLWKNEIK